MLWGQLAPQYQGALQSRKQLPLQLIDGGTSLSMRRLPLDWQPTIPEGVAIAPSGFDFVMPPPFDWVGETSRHIGTLVHRELDRLTRRIDPDALTSSLQQSAGRLAIELAELGVPPERCESGVQRVIEAIGFTLSDPRGRWLMGLNEPLSQVESEFALSGIIDSKIVNIVIDRTFIDASGTRWIVDFKTSTHEGGGLDRFLAEEEERYRPQLTRYAQLMRRFAPDQPIRTALYFPLLKAWREVEC
jgi:ATP-dependent exoDNAse (exonuclease V) beta subunit